MHGWYDASEILSKTPLCTLASTAMVMDNINTSPPKPIIVNRVTEGAAFQK